MKFKILFLICLFYFVDLNFAQIATIDSNDEKVCDSKDFENSDWKALADAAALSQQCLDVTRKIFAQQYTSSTIRIMNVAPASFNVLKYFGDLIASFELDLSTYQDRCNATELSTYRKFVLLVNQKLQKSVKSIEIGSNPCDFNMFDELKGPYKKAESVKIYQKVLKINEFNLRLNDMFPVMRKLNLYFQSINDPKFVDCEIHFLDELTIDGGLIKNTSYDSTFESFLIKNPLIQRLTVKSPTYRTFQLLQKYLRRLEEVYVRDSVYKSDHQQPELFFPNVKKLDFNLNENCHQPYEATFGGEKLQELSLDCLHEHIDYEYFSTLYRYPNISTLTAYWKLENRDLLKMIGKFPFLTEATTSLSKDVTSNSIVNFIEKSNKLKKMFFVIDKIENPDEMEKQLQSRMGGNFTIAMRKDTDSTHFNIDRKPKSTSSATTKHVTSSLLISVIMIYISRLF